MIKQAVSRSAVLGLDVGKSSHWACPVTRPGEVLANGPAANREEDLDALFSRAGEGTLVVSTRSATSAPWPSGAPGSPASKSPT